MSIMSDFKYEESDTEGAWILMQIADSAFPTGGFSHSIGFESATKHGFVKDFNAFTVFVLSCLQNAASFSLPFVNESHAECQNIEKIVELDGIMQAFLSNHVANKASFRQGNSLLVTACKTFEVEQIRSLQAQSIQFKLQKKAEEIRKRYENCMVEEATTTAPVTDFLQGVHDSLFSKLFYS
ncbi:PREDICTED: urease accessory protein F-like isoform X2 [Acropora digitifera]|uniref:urease accessory protein F-like isoform X2 n=1 Tax=Acropora digitifera TaxID=70779 RepID=UPI00077A4A4B|nr:PREDICTED: urease accessory protein F-like isoform X2 [Acropora digitifera]